MTRVWWSLRPVVTSSASSSLLVLIVGFILTKGEESVESMTKLVVWPSPGTFNTIQVPLGENKLVSCKGEVQNLELLQDIKWYWPDGREIKENDDPSRLSLETYPDDPSILSLVFNSVSESDAGTYRCTATYAKTTPLEVNFTLTSYVPITFVDAQQDQYATKGEDYKIKCSVKSNPPSKITWSKDHLKILNSDNYAIAADGLVVRNVSDSDEGVYKCLVTVYTLGDTEARFIKLQVQEKPRIVNLVKEMEGVEGEPVHMKCTGEGKPKPEVEWLHHGQSLYGVARHTVDKYDGTLKIDSLHTTDEGDYVCMVKNNAGHAQGNVVLVIVTKPVIEEFINVTTQVDNKEVILTCRASGNPAPNIVFHKDSQRGPFVLGTQGDLRIFQEQKLGGSSVTVGTLRITDILRSDDGLYNCIASNGRTRTERQGHLTVEFPPNFDRTPAKEAWAWGGGPANLTCFADAIPNATFTWFFENRPINLDANHIIYGLQSQSTLQIRPVSRGEFGKYTCVATSKLGVANHSIFFREATVPGRIQQVILDGITATTVSFKIAGPVIHGGLPVEYYVVQYKHERDSWDNFDEKLWPIQENRITVEDLEPMRSYSFRFAAKNAVGRGEFEDKLATTTKRAQPEPPVILTEQFAYAPYPDQFEIKWSHPQDNGERIDKFEISYIPVRNTSVSSGWESDGNSNVIVVPSPHLSHLLSDLLGNKYYRVEVRAHNILGWGNPSHHIVVKTAAPYDARLQGSPNPASTSQPFLSANGSYCAFYSSLISLLFYRSQLFVH